MGRELNKHSTCTYQKSCGCVFYSVEKVVFRKMFFLVPVAAVHVCLHRRVVCV